MDVEDGQGRTPLQLAVANLMQHLAGQLLDHGVNTNEFKFPTAIDLGLRVTKTLESRKVQYAAALDKLVNQLHRCYKLDCKDIVKIVKFVLKFKIFLKPSYYDSWLQEEDEEFDTHVKQTIENLDVCFYDLIRTKDDRATQMINERLQENVDWTIEGDRMKFLRKLDPVITDWEVDLPNLRDFFTREKIECLLFDSVKYMNENKSYILGERFIRFVSSSGYRDEPDPNKYGKPSPRRTTPLHRLISQVCNYVAKELFEIYNRFDVNYTDESGLSHYHVACERGCAEAVEKFLEFGQDPNCLVAKTGDLPLNLSLAQSNEKLVELLLRNGADPNLANTEGSTPLHIVCKMNDYAYILARTLLKISDDVRRTVQVDARDNWGRTPLHWAMHRGSRKKVALLLRRGADPNSTDAEGSTPLHVCLENHDDDLTGTFFGINKAVDQPVRVDARDNRGRTPLQLSVAHLLPDVVYVLLNNGADLSSFVFPFESDFEEHVKAHKSYKSDVSCERYERRMNDTALIESNENVLKLKVTFNGLGVIHHLENRGYHLDRCDAIKIMNVFMKHGLFETPANVDSGWNNDKNFATRAKNITMMTSRSLSFYDMMRLPTERAAKKFTYLDFIIVSRLLGFFENIRQAINTKMAAILLRGFFWVWAVHSFMELTRNVLPIECCEMIIDQLFTNQDLYNICVAATLRE
ncbi:hypothetical protein TKK_0004541 [Trichogramma kaykai]